MSNPPIAPIRMSIGYDASVTLAPGRGGIARYTLELLRALVGGAALDADFTVLLNSLRHPPGPDHAFLLGHPRVRVVRRRWPGPLLVRGWTSLGRPSWERLTGQSCRVVHAPATYFPPTRAPLVATVHDLAFLSDAQRDPLAGGYLAQELPRRLPSCAAVITPSRHVADEVATAYGIPRERLHPIHSGIDGTLFQPEGPRRNDIDVLAITDSRIERKRPDWIPAIAARLNAGRATPWRIAVVGWRDAAPPPGVTVLPWLDDAGLAAAYRGARATLLTTRAEGFGFPLLESLACGTPVACGRHSSLTEVGGPFAAFAPAEDPTVYTETLRALLDAPPAGAWRHEASAHARSFTWERAASRTMDVYQRVGAIDAPSR